MFTANFPLKSLVQKSTVFFRRTVDYSDRHPYRALEKDALADTVAFIKAEMPDALAFDTPRELLHFAIGLTPCEGLVAEFGVNEGGTIRFIANRMRERTIHGFDSFEGLPEHWTGNNMPSGHFGRHGRLPKVPPNVTLHKGWFDETMPAFAAAHPGRAAFLHVDCDLYSSTKTILDNLAGGIGTGTIIVFDEYFNYPNWRNHEHRAFRAFADERQIAFRYIGYAFRQVAVAIDGIAS